MCLDQYGGMGLIIMIIPDNIVITYSRESLHEYFMGKLELDIDPLAERHAVIDRSNGDVFYIGNNDVNVHYVDFKYTITSNLIVIILDDTREFNAAAIDGVTCEPVNLATV
jgi:hypothetical protein